jgi:methionyl-tRNA formyltransferase
VTRAVVFAYHNVGSRCLEVLVARGIDVRLVVTHEDNPHENVWFASVAETARRHGIAVITPADPNAPDIVARVRAEEPEFLFSFYYRQMLKRDLLLAASRGAYNMHGSLLPKYRGRVPVNWAIIHGESETGVTLHAMTEKPDNGAIVIQKAVPIGPDDTAKEVFDRITEAAAAALDSALPALVAGTAPHLPQDPSRASYFGGRKPEDGRIDFAWGAKRIHDFVRALTRPYPGAFADVNGHRLVFWRTRRTTDPSTTGEARLSVDGRIALDCADGGVLEVTELAVDGKPADAQALRSIMGERSIRLA